MKVTGLHGPSSKSLSVDPEASDNWPKRPEPDIWGAGIAETRPERAIRRRNLILNNWNDCRVTLE
jgi:hypothetical protein